jgi:hypothetical protein
VCPRALTRRGPLARQEQHVIDGDRVIAIVAERSPAPTPARGECDRPDGLVGDVLVAVWTQAPFRGFAAEIA